MNYWLFSNVRLAYLPKDSTTLRVQDPSTSIRSWVHSLLICSRDMSMEAIPQLISISCLSSWQLRLALRTLSFELVIMTENVYVCISTFYSVWQQLQELCFLIASIGWWMHKWLDKPSISVFSMHREASHPIIKMKMEGEPK